MFLEVTLGCFPWLGGSLSIPSTAPIPPISIQPIETNVRPIVIPVRNIPSSTPSPEPDESTPVMDFGRDAFIDAPREAIIFGDSHVSFKNPVDYPGVVNGRISPTGENPIDIAIKEVGIPISTINYAMPGSWASMVGTPEEIQSQYHFQGQIKRFKQEHKFFNPEQFAIVSFGTNDYLSGKVTTQQIIEGVVNGIEQLKELGAKNIYVITPMGHPDYVKLLKEKTNVYVIDTNAIFNTFPDKGVAKDGIHWSLEAQVQVGRYLEAEINQMNPY